MDKGGNSQDIQVTRDGCGCVIVNSGPQDARRTATQPCETHKVTAVTHRAQADAVHAAHCCARHGCKYGTDGTLCGVRAGRVQQLYPCEFCGMEDEEHKDCVPLNRQEREELEHLRQNATILSASTLDEALKLELVKPYREKIAELEETVFQLRMEINRLRGLA